MRCAISSMTLAQTAVFSMFIFTLRLHYLSEVTRLQSMIISITVIFLSEMELGLESQVKDPSSYVQIGSFFKTLKAVVTIAVFTLNSNKNDYFMALFFFWTCLMGSIYLLLAGFEIPKQKEIAYKERHRTKENFEAGIMLLYVKKL